MEEAWPGQPAATHSQHDKLGWDEPQSNVCCDRERVDLRSSNAEKGLTLALSGIHCTLQVSFPLILTFLHIVLLLISMNFCHDPLS